MLDSLGEPKIIIKGGWRKQRERERWKCGTVLNIKMEVETMKILP